MVCAAGVSAEIPRFALVIGNGNYQGLPVLKNPTNDASDMAAALKRLGFGVELLTNAELPAMEEAAARLADKLGANPQAIGLFYFAGHGVQSQGTNYLIPVKTAIAAEAFLKTKALSAQSVLDLMQGAGNSLNLVLLDACRDNPFSWSRSAASRGLSVVGVQPPGSIVVFATSAGSVAQDGTGRNGLFTQELLKNLETPDIDLNTMLDRTANGVQKASANKQVPAVYKQYFGQARLNGSAPSAPSPAVQTPATPAGATTASAAEPSYKTAFSSKFDDVLYKYESNPALTLGYATGFQGESGKRWSDLGAVFINPLRDGSVQMMGAPTARIDHQRAFASGESVAFQLRYKKGTVFSIGASAWIRQQHATREYNLKFDGKSFSAQAGWETAASMVKLPAKNNPAFVVAPDTDYLVILGADRDGNSTLTLCSPAGERLTWTVPEAYPGMYWDVHLAVGQGVLTLQQYAEYHLAVDLTVFDGLLRQRGFADGASSLDATSRAWAMSAWDAQNQPNAEEQKQTVIFADGSMLPGTVRAQRILKAGDRVALVFRYFAKSWVDIGAEWVDGASGQYRNNLLVTNNYGQLFPIVASNAGGAGIPWQQGHDPVVPVDGESYLLIFSLDDSRHLKLELASMDGSVSSIQYQDALDKNLTWTMKFRVVEGMVQILRYAHLSK